MDLIFVLLIAAGALVLGGVGGYLVFRYVLKGKYREMVDAAEKQAEEERAKAEEEAEQLRIQQEEEQRRMRLRRRARALSMM